jgi:3-methyladenine DNA glycosylase Tag
MKLNLIYNKSVKGIVDFIDDKEVVRHNNKIYPLVYNAKGVKTLYSLPNNDRQEPYTMRTNVNIDTLVDKAIVLTYWSIFKKNDSIKGLVINETFVVDEETI